MRVFIVVALINFDTQSDDYKVTLNKCSKLDGSIEPIYMSNFVIKSMNEMQAENHWGRSSSISRVLDSKPVVGKKK